MGVVMEYMVNASLMEISINPMFSASFGICFIALGVIIGWRVWVPDAESPDRSSLLKQLTGCFAVMVVATGIFCFFLDKYWFSALPPGCKIPMYACLGSSITYALCFAVTDMLNQGVNECRCCHRGEEGAVTRLVSTPMQLWSLMGIGMISGGFYGYLFGVIDVEDDDAFHDKFKEQELFSIPLGLVLGGIAGWANDKYRHIEEISFSAIPNDHGFDFDDDAFDGLEGDGSVEQCDSLFEDSPY